MNTEIYKSIVRKSIYQTHISTLVFNAFPIIQAIKVAVVHKVVRVVNVHFLAILYENIVKFSIYRAI